ncbi:alpha/beta hydrolase family protein [Fibrobacterota bacterium]
MKNNTFKFAEWENESKTIRASLYITEGKEAPWIIMCPGFTSNRIGPKYFYTTMARHFTSNGISVVSFDFAGTGESDGLFSDITISSMCSDLISAYHFVKSNYTLSKLLVLGHSLGGTIAALTLKDITIDGLILISPLADTKKHSEQHEYIVTNGLNEEGYYEFGPHEMKIDFLNEFKTCDPVNAISKNFKGKIILLQGDNDDQITPEESFVFLNRAHDCDIDIMYHTVKNGDHRFSNVPSRKFIQQTIVNWIKEKIL